MKTKLLFLRWIMIVILSVSAIGTWAQSTTDPDHACLNSLENYWVVNTPGSTYNWVLSGGGTITTGQSTDQISIHWTSTGPYTLTVTETFTSTTGCVGLPVLLNIIVDPLPIPTLAGPTPVCVNSTGNVYTTESGMTGYVWNVVGGTITSGGTVTDNTATITWNTTGAQSVSVNYTDLAGCTAAAAIVYNVTVNPLPVVTLTGPSPVCVNSTGNVYTTEAGMSSYLWTVSAGGTITAGGGINDNTVTITWNTAAPQTVSVNYTNGTSCTAAAVTVFNVTVNPLPVVTITGPSPVCLNSTGNAYTTEAGMSNYLWTVSAGGTITAGGGINDNTVTITWNTAAPQTVSVNYTNGTSCTAAAVTVFNVTVNPLPVVTITGPSPVCLNSTGNVYTTEAGMSSYLWTVSAGGTITAGAGTNAITVTWNTAGAQTVSVNYNNTNGCTAATATVYNVTVNPLPVPTITGPSAACVTSTTSSYSTEAGMTGYTWTVSAGGTITAGAGTDAITVTWNTAGAQTVSVNYDNANGCTAASATVYNVTVNPLPVPTITGPTPICATTTGNVYTTETGMTGYTWTVSAGGTITAGAGTNAITVTWNTAGAQTVSVNYNNANVCTAATATIYNVTVNSLPSTSPIWHN